MAVLVFLTDRAPDDALPALADLHLDVKHETLSVTALRHVAAIGPGAVLVDAVDNPAHAWTVLREPARALPLAGVRR